MSELLEALALVAKTQAIGELLAACQAFLEWEKHTPNPPDGWLSDVVRDIKAAISKAEGRS